MANLRQLQKEATRQRLLASALELFERNGYVATTIDDIAAAAGTTRVTFYAYFESRSDVMRALIDELNAILGRHDEPGRGSTTRTLVDAVRDGSHAALAVWLWKQATRWPKMRPYILSATEASAVDPDIRVLFHGWFEEVIADITEGLDLADRFDPATRHARAELVLAALDHTAIDWMRRQWGLEREAPQIQVLAEAWHRLVGGGAGRADGPGTAGDG